MSAHSAVFESKTYIPYYYILSSLLVWSAEDIAKELTQLIMSIYRKC